MKVYGLAHCSTTKKALALLQEQYTDVELIDYRDHPIPEATLRDLIQRSNRPVRQWFNTSGQLYRDLKAQLQTLSEAEQITMLATHPMLIKRPVVVMNDQVYVGLSKSGY